MQHNQGFLKIVDEARQGIVETTVEKVRQRQEQGETFHLVDVREDSEWSQDRIPGALHIGKGVIERDIEGKIADKTAPIILYCGGGYRSALAAAALKQMGYTQVESMDGGMRGWKGAGYPVDR